MYNYERDEDEEPRDGLGGRWRSWFGLGRKAAEDDDDDFEDDGPSTVTTTRSNPSAASTPLSSTPPLRMTTTRDGSITIMPATSMADVQKAADRLKNGEPQIVNLEKTPPAEAQRLIDFLNGVVYAMDGYVEKIAEGAYLFTPASVTIHSDKPDAVVTPKSYFGL